MSQPNDKPLDLNKLRELADSAASSIGQKGWKLETYEDGCPNCGSAEAHLVRAEETRLPGGLEGTDEVFHDHVIGCCGDSPYGSIEVLKFLDAVSPQSFLRLVNLIEAQTRLLTQESE